MAIGVFISVVTGLIKAYNFLSRDGDSKFNLQTKEPNKLKFKRTNIYLPRAVWAPVPYDTVTIIAGKNFIGKDSVLSKIRLYFQDVKKIGQKELLDNVKLLCIQNMKEDEYTHQFVTWVEVKKKTHYVRGLPIEEDYYHLTIIIGIDETTYDFKKYINIKTSDMKGECIKRAKDLKEFISRIQPDKKWNVIVSRSKGAENWGYSIQHGGDYIKTEWKGRYCYVVFNSPKRTGNRVSKDSFDKLVNQVTNGPEYRYCTSAAKVLKDKLKEKYPKSKWAALVKFKPGGGKNWGYTNHYYNKCYYKKWKGDYCYVAWKVG